jgi:Tol biopolymer transport system component
MKRFVIMLGIVAAAALSVAAIAQRGKEAETLFHKGVHLEEAQGDLKEAIAVFEKLVAEYPEVRPVVAKAILHIGICHEKMGQGEARRSYQRILDEFADMDETAAEAKVRLSALEVSGGSRKPGDIIVRRLFQDDGTGFVGSPSPDGRLFSDIDRKTGNLVVRDLASGSVRLVTNAPGVWDEYALYSVFSADGKKLAYTWLNKEGMFEIRTIGLDGTGIRTVLGGVNAIDIGPVGWSSDGRNILAFIYKVGGISQIVLISAEDASSRVLKKFEETRLGTARLSPDGKFVAYDRVTEKPARSSDIYLIPTAGGDDIPLVSHEAMDSFLGWTPDGKGILFVSDRTGSFDAWLLRVADGRPLGDPVLVRKGIGTVAPLGFDRNGSFFYGVQAQGFDVYVASVDIEAGKVLAPPVPVAKRYVGSNDSPGWSPDGKTLAYVLRSASAPKSLLCLRSMESGEERDLALKMYVRWPQWSPDGRRILVWGRKDPADYGYYFVDPQTGTVSPFVLDTENQSIYRAVWSLDGKAVYFVRATNDPKGESRLIRRDVETGRETEILRDTLVTGIAVSPDGQSIAFRSYDDPDVTLMIMPSSGGEIQELARVKKPDVISMAQTPYWTPDGRYLLYTVTRVNKPYEPAETKTELWRLDMRTKEAKSLGPAIVPVLTLAIHPDGKRIAFDSGVPKVELWVMENFLDRD